MPSGKLRNHVFLEAGGLFGAVRAQAKAIKNTKTSLSLGVARQILEGNVADVAQIDWLHGSEAKFKHLCCKLERFLYARAGTISGQPSFL